MKHPQVQIRSITSTGRASPKQFKKIESELVVSTDTVWVHDAINHEKSSISPPKLFEVVTSRHEA